MARSGCDGPADGEERQDLGEGGEGTVEGAARQANEQGLEEGGRQRTLAASAEARSAASGAAVRGRWPPGDRAALRDPARRPIRRPIPRPTVMTPGGLPGLDMRNPGDGARLSR